MPALRRHDWTVDEVDRLVNERKGYTPRYELVDGELLVTPAPSGMHQRIVMTLMLRIHPYVVKHRLGDVGFGPGEVRLTSDTRFEPDLFVIPSLDGRRPLANAPVTRLLLAVEVLSPSSSRHDRVTKRRFFQRHGVPDYWIVDSDTEAFEIWHPGDPRSALVDERFTWWPTGAEEGLEIDVAGFFAEVADDSR